VQGLHLTADLRGCQATELLVDRQALAAQARAATEAAGLSVVAEHWHPFPERGPGQPGGFTGMLLLAESHLAIHTWPELAGATLDVYVCNYGADNSVKARALMDALLALLQPQHALQQALQRG
jgi:S-adenosylmethionine decarboxylase proenzyme